jgi:hypothetical protein
MQESRSCTSYLLDSASEIVELADALDHGLVFRGQSNWEWEITSSLERGTEGLNHSERADCEAATLKGIKQAEHSVGTLAVRPEDDFSWLALLQHHGGYTRLVDFTESFYVALYFAVRNCPGTDATVWCVPKGPLDGRMVAIQEEAGFELSGEELPRRLVNNSIEWPDRYRGNRALSVVHAKPSILNQRLAIQQGLFLCPLNLDRPFMDNLSGGLGVKGSRKPVEWVELPTELKGVAARAKTIKIIVRSELHRDILFHLRRMSITEATLFPGLDGYARSLNYFAMGIE